MDFITHLPPSSGQTAIMVVVDRLTKYSHFSPLKHGYTASDVANVFIRDVIKLHGFPASIVSDRDPIFMSKFWKALFRQQGTLLSHTTAYHPQGDGQTEVVNRSLEDYLRSFVSDHQRDWIHLLPWAEYSYNTALHSSIGMTPYEALYGRVPPSMLDHIPGAITVAAVEDQVLKRTQLLSELMANLTKARHRMQQQANAKRQDKVFQILERIGEVAYCLNLPPTARIHNVFHVGLLRRFLGDTAHTTQNFSSQFEGSKPFLLPDRILKTRKVRTLKEWRTQLLIKWKDLLEADATWEFEDELLIEFPDLNLEDKVALDGGGIDGNHVPEKQHTGMHETATTNQEEGPPVEPAPLHRGTRTREASRRLTAGEYVMHN
ncbi:unnamed protein product [Rhodiola kirilowii]